MDFQTKEAYKIVWDRNHGLKIKEHEVKITIFFLLVALCFKKIDGLMFPTASANLNAKKCRQYMQECRPKIEVTSSMRNQNT